MPGLMLKLAAAAAVLIAAPQAAADTVTDWWDFTARLANPYAPGPKTPDSFRAGTRATLAMFEAVNAIDRRYESYLKLPAGDPSASQDVAAATAAYTVLLQHFPAKKAVIEESYALAMSGMPAGPAREAGRLIGEGAAKAAMSAGGVDPAIAQAPYRPRAEPGQWVATELPDLPAFMAAYKPWVIASPSALRSPPPPPMTSAVWASSYEEVRRLGGKASTERTPVQTLIARYRQAFDLTPALRQAADAPGRSQVQNARMFALYQMAFDDAAEAMIESKLHYEYWRPITAIRNGANDGNPATAPDPAWESLLGTPNFQEYPCGHCTVAAAAAEVMKAETGPRPAGGVRVAAMGVPGSAIQVVASWDEWAQQVSDSRIYGGVHFRFSNEAGEQIGRRAARAALDTVMRPLPGAGGRRRP